jgi:hypothetical protein
VQNAARPANESSAHIHLVDAERHCCRRAPALSPVAVLIPAKADDLPLISRRVDARQARDHDARCVFNLTFMGACGAPQALEHGDDWTQVLTVLRLFVAHRRPDIYLRQLDTNGRRYQIHRVA